MEWPFQSESLRRERLELASGRRVAVPVVALTFLEWRGRPLTDSYGGKPVVQFKGKPLFAELAILGVLRSVGWGGVWVDGFRGAFRRGLPPSSCRLPAQVQRLYSRIVNRNGGKKSGCWDVLAWKGNQLLFIESKRKGRDSIRRSQRRWLEAAMKAGVPRRSFVIAEWTLCAVANARSFASPSFPLGWRLGIGRGSLRTTKLEAKDRS